jgi:hypothetical protein
LIEPNLVVILTLWWIVGFITSLRLFWEVDRALYVKDILACMVAGIVGPILPLILIFYYIASSIDNWKIPESLSSILNKRVY